MTETTDRAVDDREYWHGVLTAGGITRSRDGHRPGPGVAEHEAPLPDELATALHRLPDELAIPLRTMLLAAHAKVLAALSGERDVSPATSPAQAAGRCRAG